jgi:hypothetical protein
MSNTISHIIEASLLRRGDILLLGYLGPHRVSRIEWESPRRMRLRLFNQNTRRYHFLDQCPFAMVRIRG